MSATKFQEERDLNDRGFLHNDPYSGYSTGVNSKNRQMASHTSLELS